MSRLPFRSTGPKALVGPLFPIVPLAALALHAASPASPQEPLAEAPIALGFGGDGVLLEVPDEGLLTLDGPGALLMPGFAEWFGVYYELPEGVVEGAGCGTRPDWAGRERLELVARGRDGDQVVVVTRLGDLEIETRFAADRENPFLVLGATFTNRGERVLGNLFYTREWSAPPGEGWDFPPDLELPFAASSPSVRRVAWMLEDLAPGASTGVVFSYGSTADTAGGVVDVPLTLFVNDDFPNGVPVGDTNGISFGDYDADGWIDVYACESSRLWRNLAGESWELAATIPLPATSVRYGSSFGDYDNDGLPDLATEPRNGSGDTCMHVLHNLGGGPNFVDIATDPDLVDLQPCGADAETICWGDVDDDGDLDCFLPVYPPWVNNQPGNFFLENLGPTGPGGQYRFTETSAEAGLDNVPPSSARSEGAQFVDADMDGDIDLYCCGHFYQNVSSTGAPLFQALPSSTSGISFSTSLDEGAGFFDYDLDGDQDLVVVFTQQGVRLYENRGDGSYLEVPGLIDSPNTGLNLGMSSEDWDNDGDVDFTTRQVFRRNMLMEEGERHFVVASHAIPGSHLTSATPAWGDWDRDGDLDCALGNWLSTGHLYENTTYGPSTPKEDRHYLRVRPLRDSETVPGGLETEFGATVEVRLLDDDSGRRHRKFTASSAGYLNQNEYALHFALPVPPGHGLDFEDLRVEVTVDFPGDPAAGLVRIDKHVNPVLGGLRVAALTDREIRVFRSGRVVLEGQDHFPPVPCPRTRLRTAAGGLKLPTPTVGVGPLLPAPGPDWFVGVDFDTFGARAALQVKELIVDGELAAPAACILGDQVVAVWDVSDPAAPELVAGSRAVASTPPNNRRTFVPADFVLLPGRHYRLVARVDSVRSTPVAAPIDEGEVTIRGGLSFGDADPCSGLGAAGAAVDPSAIWLTFRYAPTDASRSVHRNGSGVNRPGFRELEPPVIGRTWTTQIELGGGFASLFVVSLRGPLPGIVLNGFVTGELLARPPFLPPDVQAGLHQVPLPADCGLLGLPFTTQGAVLRPSGVELLNAIDFVIGAY